MSEEKFRPYFTSSELTEVITALKERPTPARLNIIKYLERYSIKINHGIISPAHVLEPSMSEKLGFDSKNPDPSMRPDNLYLIWTDNPSSLTPKQLEIVQEHRYHRGLMDAQEAIEYENELMKGI